MTARIGSLFSGYGGLDLAVQNVYDAAPVWNVEHDPAPSAILAHHWPEVPNHGDVTAVDWSTLEPVDILTGGFPCQDVSLAGRRAGMLTGTRSGLWAHMVRAIDALRPQLVIIENVGGLFSARADSVMEPHPWCLGDGGTGSNTVLLRAIDAVLATLSELGYDAEWTALRASDAGAPHGRLRVFITAHPSSSRSGRRPAGSAPARRDNAPIRSDSRSDRRRADSGVTLTAGTPHILPTPEAELDQSSSDDLTATIAHLSPHDPANRFGPYADAIARWAAVIGRPAPAPTEPGRDRPRLSARFVEWMMGLEDGHVTAVPGLTRTQQLRALGNGVVPQQGAAALEYLHDVRMTA